MDVTGILERALGRQVEGLTAEDLPAVREIASSLAAATATYLFLAGQADTPPERLEIARGNVVTATVLLHQELERRLKARGVALVRDIVDVVLQVLLALLLRRQ